MALSTPSGCTWSTEFLNSRFCVFVFSCAFKVPTEEVQEQVPLHHREGMSSGMVIERQLAADDRRVGRWEFGDAEVFFTEEAIHGPCSDFGKEFALRIRPLIHRAASNKDGPRRA